MGYTHRDDCIKKSAMMVSASTPQPSRSNPKNAKREQALGYATDRETEA